MKPRVIAAQSVDRYSDELVDVADIVGEEHEMLEMLGRSAGVMPQPGEAEVRARTIEQSERARSLGPHIPYAIGDFISDMDQLVRGEEARQLGRPDVSDLDPAVFDHIGVGNLARRAADRDL